MSAKRALVSAALVLTIACALLILFAPKPSLYPDVNFSAGVQDRNGRLLRLALADDQRYRLHLSLDAIAPSVIDATLLYEDRHFHDHPGFNPGALLRAGWSTYIKQNRVIGGSTITMQLARLSHPINTRTPYGKLQQIARAVQLERHYSKREILEAYLNLAPYGGNIEGIGAAALIYFNKSAMQLSLPEALALVVIPQNPAKRNPASVTGYNHMARARARLLDLWATQFDLKEITREQFALPLAVRSTRSLPYRAAHFSRRVMAQAPRTQALISTTLDWPLQNTIEKQINRYVDRKRSLGLTNASVMLLDHRSMEVLASAGSADFFNDGIQGQVDGTTAKRSPGSTLKPFVYGMAIDRGLIHPMSLLKDAPRRYAAYTPENFDRGFMGPIVAQDALIYSRNVPAIELLSRLGHRQFHDFLVRGNVSDLRAADYYGLAAVLGGNELTMTELVALYAMLANGGKLQQLVSRQDQAASNRTLTPTVQLLGAEASFLVLDMLRRNPRPNSLTLKPATQSIPIAWKTGTSYAFRDAWTVGVIGPYVLAVWVGNFDGSSNSSFVGRQAAAPLFFEIADQLSAKIPKTPAIAAPPPALNLRKVEVCASTGDLPGQHCPQTAEAWFVPGLSPIKVSNVHRAIRIDNDSGERSCSYDRSTTHEEIYEFWPSDISRLLQQAGIALRQPPRWSSECSLDRQAAQGQIPEITSPAADLTYHLPSQTRDDARLPLTAITDSDAKWLYWFSNNRFIAKVRRDEPLLWEPNAGQHTIIAVDDLGRSTSRELVVRRI